MQNHVLSFVPLLSKANRSRPKAPDQPFPSRHALRSRPKALKSAWGLFPQRSAPPPASLATRTFQIHFRFLSFVPPIRNSHPPPPAPSPPNSCHPPTNCRQIPPPTL